MASFKLSCQTYRNDGSSRQYRDSLSQQQTRISLTCRTGEKKKLGSAHIPCLQEGILVLGGSWGWEKGKFWTFHSRRNMADFHTQAHSSIQHKHTPEPTVSVCVFLVGWVGGILRTCSLTRAGKSIRKFVGFSRNGEIVLVWGVGVGVGRSRFCVIYF